MRERNVDSGIFGITLYEPSVPSVRYATSYTERPLVTLKRDDCYYRRVPSLSAAAAHLTQGVKPNPVTTRSSPISTTHATPRLQTLQPSCHWSREFSGQSTPLDTRQECEGWKWSVRYRYASQ